MLRTGSTITISAVVAVEMRASRSHVLGVARIVADDDFDIGSRPGTGLGDPRNRQQIVPVGRKQDGELHGRQGPSIAGPVAGSPDQAPPHVAEEAGQGIVLSNADSESAPRPRPGSSP